MSFALEERPAGWCDEAPIQIRHELFLPASPERVFDVMADIGGWTAWFRGMRRIRIDGPATGVGARRTVWVGLSRVGEHFTVWEPGRHLAFHIVDCNLPGLKVMVEDYQIEPDSEGGVDGSRLRATVAVEAKRPLALLPGLVRLAVGRPTSGALGIADVFTKPPEASAA